MSLAYNSFYNLHTKQALQFVLKAAQEHGTSIVIPSAYNPLDAEASSEFLATAPVDGFILVPPVQDSPLNVLRSTGLPLVAISGLGQPDIPDMAADNFQGGLKAGEHLRSLGHKRVACLYHDQRGELGDRRAGFEAGIGQESHSGVRCKYVRSGLNVHEGRIVGLTLLKQKLRPTAIFCVNDHTACGVLQAANDLGISVPRELSVVGFDDDILSHSSSVPLTTIRQPMDNMAQGAVDALMSLIRGESAENRQFPCELIIRESTSHPPAK